MESKILHTDIELHYLYNKVNKKPTIIFIHGAGSNHSVYKPFFDAFKDSNFIAVDLANHGKSSYRNVDDITINTLASDIWNICEKEKIKEIIIIGNSLGATVGYHLYKQHRWNVKKLVLLTLFDKRYVRFSGLFIITASVMYPLLKHFTQKRPLTFQDYHKYEKRPLLYYPILDIRGTPITTVLKIVKELCAYHLYISTISVPTQIFIAAHDYSTRNSLIQSDAGSNKHIEIVTVMSHHAPLTRIYDEIIEKVKMFLYEERRV